MIPTLILFNVAAFYCMRSLRTATFSCQADIRSVMTTSSFWEIFTAAGGICTMFVWHALSFVWICILCGYHLFLAASELTTNEMENYNRYGLSDGSGKIRNPFSKGTWLKNCISFWLDGHSNQLSSFYESESMIAKRI